MDKAEYQQLFLFAAKVGSLEGYLFRRRKVEPLTIWIDNITQMYQDLSPAVKSVVDPVFAPVLERILSHGSRVLEVGLKEKVEQMLLVSSAAQKIKKG